MNYHSALKWEEILTYVTKWVTLEDIMVSEVHLSENTSVLFHLNDVLRIVKSVGQRAEQTAGFQGLGGGRMGVVYWVQRFSFTRGRLHNRSS